ncbi:hypothetical protein ATKI12_8652 [Kitasatospora sp. Ki12]
MAIGAVPAGGPVPRRWPGRPRASRPGRTRVAGGGPGGEVVQGALVGDAHVLEEPDAVAGRVGGAVEDEAVDPLRVQLRVHRAQHRAVGLPEEGGPLLAEGGAQQVGVAGDVAGGQVRQQVGVPGPAGVGVGLGQGPGLLEAGPVGAHRPQPTAPGETAVEAAAGADPAGVHADDVEGGGRRGRHHGPDRGGHGQSAGAGAAGVGLQDAVALGRVGGLDPGDGEGEGAAAGFAVVQRDGQGRAPGAGGGQFRVLAGGPGERLAAVALQRVGSCGGDGGEDGGRGQGEGGGDGWYRLHVAQVRRQLTNVPEADPGPGCRGGRAIA